MHTNISYQGKVFLVFGESQKGKSSFLRDLTKEMTIAVGNHGTGASTTSEIRCYTSKNHFKGAVFIDTVGLYGSDLNTREKLLQSLQWFLINKNLGKTISGVIIIQSYTGDSLSIAKGVEFISQVFGKVISESTTIFMTKRNMLETDGEYCKERKISAENQAKRLRISKKVIDIQTTYTHKPTITNEQNQINQIETILKSLKPIQLAHVQEKLNSIEKRAQQIRIQGKTIQYSTVTWTEEVSRGGIQGFFGGKRDIQRSKTVANDVFPLIQGCRQKAKQQFYQKVRDNILLK